LMHRAHDFARSSSASPSTISMFIVFVNLDQSRFIFIQFSMPKVLIASNSLI
jgi:hypothetical protein